MAFRMIAAIFVHDMSGAIIRPVWHEQEFIFEVDVEQRRLKASDDFSYISSLSVKRQHNRQFRFHQ